MAATQHINFSMGGQEFRVTQQRVRRALRGITPAPLHEHFVVVDGTRYPPKQVMAAVTGLPVGAFTTHQAVRNLRKLGFVTGRRSAVRHVGRSTGALGVTRGRTSVPEPVGGQNVGVAARRDAASGVPSPQAASADGSTLDQQLRSHVGEWVAVRGPELLVAAPEARTVIAWLTANGERAASMYKVPADLAQTAGAAPG